MNKRTLFLNYLAQTSDSPLAFEITHAEGVYLYGPQGQKYMDLISGIGVSALGHNHPEVVKAVITQAQKYMHVMVYGELVLSPQVLLAEKICSLLPAQLNNVYLTNSGTEAIEGAMKLAKRFTGRKKFLFCQNAYHGATQGALSLAGSEDFKKAFYPLLEPVEMIRYGEIEDLSKIDQSSAAIVIETIQAEAGVQMASQAYMKALREKCTQTGTLLILDEVQNGAGRTGKMWGFEHYEGLVPDVLVLAKGIGGGMPIGAFIAPQQIMQVFKTNPILGHITTFGGHPVSAAAALATLSVISQQNLPALATQKGAYFAEKLRKLPSVIEVRQVGLMIAVELGSFDKLKAVIDQAIAHGLLTDWFLFCDTAMRIAPPLLISYQEIDLACQILHQILTNN